jgi:hypothetical protein
MEAGGAGFDLAFVGVRRPDLELKIKAGPVCVKALVGNDLFFAHFYFSLVGFPT